MLVARSHRQEKVRERVGNQVEQIFALDLPMLFQVPPQFSKCHHYDPQVNSENHQKNDFKKISARQIGYLLINIIT